MTDINVSLRELKLVVGRLLFVSGLPRGCVYPVRDVLVDAQTLGLDAVQSLEDTLDRLPGDAGAVLVRAESPGSLIVDAVGAPSYLVVPAILDLMVAAVRRRGASDVQVVNVALPGLLRALEVSATRHGVGIELCETADERARLRGAAGIQPIDDPTDPAALTEVQLRAVRAGFDIDVDLWWRMAKPSDDDLTPTQICRAAMPGHHCWTPAARSSGRSARTTTTRRRPAWPSKLPNETRSPRMIVIDGLECGRYNREVLAEFTTGGMSAVQNAIGGSCYEPHDRGLSRFGREVVREMNRVGMLVDLSHVGERTGLDAIECATRPVAVTHANPHSLYANPRNKSDELLRALADNGGIVGLATYNNICGPFAISPRVWCEMEAKTVELVGIDAVGIGTGLGQNPAENHLDWMRKGRWTRSGQRGAALPNATPAPQEWLRSTTQLPELIEALRESGYFNASELTAILGGNWMRVYEAVLTR